MSTAQTPVTATATDTLPALEAGQVRQSIISPIQNLSFFDLRNGDVSLAKSLLVRPTVPPAFHWMPIADLPPNLAVRHVDIFIRCALDKLQLENYAPTTQHRKASICLGVARAYTTQLYNIVPGDLIPGEMTAARVRYVPPTLVDPAAAGTSAATVVVDPVGTFTMVQGVERSEVYENALSLTATEQAAVAALAMSSIGLLPLQGYSLVMTNHHYLSDVKTQSRKAFAAVEKQFWGHTDIGSWFTDDMVNIQDWVWHKACHPVSLTLKRQLAFDDRIATMIKQSDAGSAAARLPAVESELRAANSYRTVMLCCRPAFEMINGAVQFDLLDSAVRAVKAFSAANPENAPTPRPQMDPDIPPSVVSRSSALAFLSDVLARNADDVSVAYGFYCAMQENMAMTGGGTTTDSLKTSFSLVKLKSQCNAAYNTGYQTYGDYVVVRNKRREAGDILPPSCIFK